ncbi:phage major capsid protein [Bifidobacterium vansinderenii]|uniref:Major capsid protein n=1 Tax=Bifidobacterium vansinderenii TaxID=1984871 RepID=A0A229VZ15_9BIFI|nr:phage major capsid protein [Bifidobacterium vansinderenii]OXN00796.1 major capsid protein [Bifidobacterium vansinderenii]
MAEVTTGNAPSVYSANYFQAESIIPDALILTHATAGGQVEGDTPVLNVPYVETLPAAQIVKEGEEIPEGNAAVSVLTIHTQKVAVINPITNEANYAAGVKTMLGKGMARSIIAKADAVFLQNPAPAEGASGVTGLFNYPGIPVAGNIADSNDGLNPIIDGITQISENGGTPTHIIMGYGTWAKLLKLRLADGTPQISPDVANAPVPVLFGIPVTLNAQAPADKIIITDKGEIIAAAGGVSGDASRDRYFERDITLMRSTFRFGFGVVHPNRLSIITTTDTTDNE